MTDPMTLESRILRCFVIGPIGSKFAPIGDPARDIYEDALDVFEKVVRPACVAFGLDPVRADQIAATGEITEQVFRRLRDDEVVIADLSGGNPNVMYELGLRHTKPLLTIQIGEYGQLPFDISAIRTIQFSRSERGLIDARKELERALSIGLAEGSGEVSATRLWNERSAGGASFLEIEEPPTAESEAELYDPELEGDGFIERIAAFELVVPSVVATTANIGEVVEGMGQLAVLSSADMQSANNSGATAQQRLGVIAKFATELQPKANELDGLTLEFEEQMANVDAQLSGVLAYLDEHPEMVNDDTGDFFDSIGGLARSTREAMENFGQFKSSLDALAGMSKMLRKPARDVSNAVHRMIKSAQLADNWETAIVGIRQKLLAKQSEDL
ncbi:hypothetical protein [Herbiconiux ginsengi]|uniref:Nucleoside 2-deoxyribosyltransferase n=1 Tax=Herbiconiux ginsengi TaxID=381665 RepID=A0A1H3S4E0_9MICO|nr:hypothetical protein [Herbiconiux ginsengi]SDZ32896.1 hypothetical protein SAMN05216554_3305 [Herbiconiux ginsengi]